MQGRADRIALDVLMALPVIDAALRAKIPYLDVTAEQPSVRAVLETRHDAACQAGIALLPAAGFYGGLADLLVMAATDSSNQLDEITVAVALDSWHPTQGTRLTGERNTAKRLVQRNGRLEPIEEPQASKPAPSRASGFVLGWNPEVQQRAEQSLYDFADLPYPASSKREGRLRTLGTPWCEFASYLIYSFGSVISCSTSAV